MPKSNNADAFKIHTNMMQISGVWPEANPGILYHIRSAITWTLGVGLSLSMILEAVNDLNDFSKLSEILYITFTITVYVMKLAFFTYRRNDFLKLIASLKDPIFVSYPDEVDHYMAKTIKISTFIANFYRYLCGVCIFLYAAYPVLDNKLLPFPFPYDVGKFRFVLYVFQVAGVSSAAWSNSCLDTLPPSLLGIAAAQLDILMEKIVMVLNSGDGEDKPVDTEQITKDLKQCVQHHLAIIKFVESIEQVFTVGFLAQFMGSVVVICNTLFHFVLISATSIQFFVLLNYFCVMVVELFMSCWYGNEIMWKSVRVGQACYASKWYNCSTKTGKYLFLIMERSKRPLIITAFKISTLSLVAFTSILQWSYSYLTLLLKMYNKSNLQNSKTI